MRETPAAQQLLAMKVVGYALKLQNSLLNSLLGREFAWRRARSALRRQPASRSTGDSEHLVGENPAFCGLFARFSVVSRLQKMATLARISGKSPAETAETPVSWRLSAETNFERTAW